MAASALITIFRPRAGRGLFSLVTGAGRESGSEGGGLVCLFSLRLVLSELIGTDIADSVDDIERLVFLRSRMLPDVAFHIQSVIPKDRAEM